MADYRRGEPADLSHCPSAMEARCTRCGAAVLDAVSIDGRPVLLAARILLIPDHEGHDRVVVPVHECGKDFERRAMPRG